MQKVKFKIHTLGCKVNYYDSRLLKSFLLQNNFKEDEEGLDLVIINTCSVTQTAVRKSRRLISKAKKNNPGARVLVMGCWPEIKREVVKEKICPDLVWGTGDVKKLAREILKLFNVKKYKLNKNIILNSEERARYFVKVQNGCEQFCSYCIIPYTRGRLRSRKIEDVYKEVKKAADSGYEEIVLSGIHLGLYGKESGGEEGISLIDLLKKLTRIKNLKKIRLSSIEVTEISKELIKFCAQEEKMCKHFHIPLQSGCDSVLQKMNRPYDTDFFFKKIKEIRKFMPEVAISTDVIVGFPGETDKDFKKTIDFIKKVEFSRLHVFPFSAHPDTPAYSMPGHLSKEKKIRRADVLRRLGRELESEYKDKFKNRELDVIVEQITVNGKGVGKTQYFFNVNFNKNDVLNNEDLLNNCLIGKLVKIKN